MNFILGLSKTVRGHDFIFVIVDKFFEMAHFVPCSKFFDASHFAKIFPREFVRLHGLPLTIMLDRDVKFVSYFYKTLSAKIGTKLKFSSALHPQTDGQTKVVDRNLGNSLHCSVHDYNILGT